MLLRRAKITERSPLCVCEREKQWGERGRACERAREREQTSMAGGLAELAADCGLRAEDETERAPAVVAVGAAVPVAVAGVAAAAAGGAASGPAAAAGLAVVLLLLLAGPRGRCERRRKMFVRLPPPLLPLLGWSAVGVPVQCKGSRGERRGAPG